MFNRKANSVIASNIPNFESIDSNLKLFTKVKIDPASDRVSAELVNIKSMLALPDKKNLTVAQFHRMSLASMQYLIKHFPEEVISIVFNSPILNTLLFLNVDRLDFNNCDPRTYFKIIEQNPQLTPLEISVAIEYLCSQNLDYLSQFNSTLLEYPESRKTVLPILFRLIEYEYSHRFFYKETWSFLTSIVAKHLPPSSLTQKQDEELKKIFLNSFISPHKPEARYLQDIVPQNFEFFKFLGRTLLFKNQSTQKILAIKLNKGVHDHPALAKEFATTRFLSQYRNQIGLKSQIPQALDLCFISDIDEFVKNQTNSVDAEIKHFKELTKLRTDCLCYIYTSPSNYFTYIHQIDDDKEFEQSIFFAFHDLMRLQEKLGMIFNQLIPLFHGNKRKYRILSNTMFGKDSYDFAWGRKGIRKDGCF